MLTSKDVDANLQTAIGIVRAAAAEKGFRPVCSEDLEEACYHAMRRYYEMRDRAASIRAAVETIDMWAKEAQGGARAAASRRDPAPIAA